MGLIPDVAARLHRALGEAVVGWRPTLGGYTPALRGVATLESGRTVFVKAALHDFVGAWLRREEAVYTALSALGAPFVPRRIGFLEDDPACPVLLLEDLSGARWPPPWQPGDVEAVRETLSAVQRCRPAAAGLSLESLSPGEALVSGWSPVAKDPTSFLGLGLVSADWLRHALPRLLAAGATAPVAGEALLHLDVRSDNLCLAGAARGALLIDWNYAMQGDAGLDLAFWAPSLHWEGGPPPEALLGEQGGGGGGGAAALVSGFFASRAGLPVPPLAPRVREVQQSQLWAALPWAIRALGLPAADGPQADRLCV